MATHSSVLAWRIPGTGEAWWAAVYGVAQSRTGLKRLSSSKGTATMLGGEAWAQIFIKQQVGQHKGFPDGTSGKEPTCQCRRCRRPRFNTWVRKIPWRRARQPLQYSCLANPIDRGAWQATVHRDAKNQPWLKWFSMHACRPTSETTDKLHDAETSSVKQIPMYFPTFWCYPLWVA